MMSESTHIKREKGDSTSGSTDYERLEKMTETEIEENAKNDPDAPLLDEEDLKKFKRVVPLKG